MNQILIVEDESRLAAFLQKGLRKNGYETVIANDGEQAVKMVLGKKFDLMVLDIGLPIKDGFTVLQELRNNQEKFPVIIITARSDDGDKDTHPVYFLVGDAKMCVDNIPIYCRCCDSFIYF